MGLGPNKLPQQDCQNTLLQITRVRLGTAGGATTSNCSNGTGPDILNLALTFVNPNNGNLASEQIANNDSTNLNVMQQFEYDAYNRLSFAIETPASLTAKLSSSSTCSSLSLTAPNEDPWRQQYGYDAFGNRWVTNWSNGSNGYPISTVTPTSSSWYSSSNNRLSTTAPGAQYDTGSASGNGNSTGLGGFAYLFDAENRMTQSTINSAITKYFYDGEGRRVNKATGNTSTTYVYDATGGLVAEYSNAPMENGGPQPAGTQYLTDDHLGSTRLVTDALGNPQKRYDYLPFGEEIPQGLDGRSMTMYWPPLMPGPAEDTVDNKFTGKERDAETGLDFFGARYVSGAQGRFTSPDWSATPQALPYADLTDPQTLNLYSYVRNNPLAHRDDDGHATIQLRYSKVLVGYHTYIVVADTNGHQTYYRAGPSQGASGLSTTPATSGKGSQSSGSNSNSSNSTSPGSGPGGPGANTGPWGALTAEHGDYKRVLSITIRTLRPR